jgi:hypothetical protein
MSVPLALAACSAATGTSLPSTLIDTGGCARNGVMWATKFADIDVARAQLPLLGHAPELVSQPADG